MDPTVPQQKPLKMLPGLAQDTNRRCPCPDQISHRFVSRVGDPDRRQLARPVQLRQHDAVSPVGLHPVTGLHRDERGRDNQAIVPEIGQLPVEAIAAGPGFVAEVKLTPATTQLLGQPADVVGAVVDRAPVAKLTAPLFPCDGDRDRRLVDVQPNKDDILHAVSPPFLRLGASPSGEILEGECRGRDHQPSLATPRSWGLVAALRGREEASHALAHCGPPTIFYTPQ